MNVSSAPTSRCGVSAGAAASRSSQPGSVTSTTVTPGRSQTVEQVSLAGFGEDELTVDARDVAGQCLAPTGRVEAAQHVTAQPGCGEGRQHLRRVAHEHADVQGAGRGPPPR